MLEKRVSDVKFGKLTIKYGRGLSYEWQVGEHVLKYSTTRHLTSQRKFRDKYLEASGIVVLRISTAAWSLILNQAYATTERHTQEELEALWLRHVARYAIEERTEEQKEIMNGKVYETNTGLVFTTAGLVKYLKQFEEMDMFLPEWHSEKVRTLLNAKSASMSLKSFKGRAVKLNNYSGRVDPRFYEYCKRAAYA